MVRMKRPFRPGKSAPVKRRRGGRKTAPVVSVAKKSVAGASKRASRARPKVVGPKSVPTAIEVSAGCRTNPITGRTIKIGGKTDMQLRAGTYRRPLRRAPPGRFPKRPAKYIPPRQ